MPNARQILERKGRNVFAISPGASVLHAAQLMNEQHIGSVLVIENDRLLGIFTERDVMRRVVAAQLDPAATQVSAVMTTRVACATPDTPYSELCEVVREQRIRHLPVIENELVIGMISIGDLNRVDHNEQEQTILYLEQFISVP